MSYPILDTTIFSHLYIVDEHVPRVFPMFEIKGRFTLWPSKSKGGGIEWPNFVDSPKKWAENNQ
jgi:hypothetical protein